MQTCARAASTAPCSSRTSRFRCSSPSCAAATSASFALRDFRVCAACARSPAGHVRSHPPAPHLQRPLPSPHATAYSRHHTLQGVRHHTLTARIWLPLYARQLSQVGCIAPQNNLLHRPLPVQCAAQVWDPAQV